MFAATLFFASIISSVPQQPPCPRGHFCPSASLAPRACPRGTYNPELGSEFPRDCRPCPAGYVCAVEAIASLDGLECPRGYVCPRGSGAAVPCAAGTHSNEASRTRGADCAPCPAGHVCPAGSTLPRACAGGTFCPAGATDETRCPEAHYCPRATPEALPCPAGSSCAAGSAVPAPCARGTVCPARSAWPAPCRAGYIASASATPGDGAVLASHDEACSPCPAGTQVSDPTRLVCAPCPAGSVCAGEATPSGGVPCPPGAYCPPASIAALPCPPGTFNALPGQVDAQACTPCDVGYFAATPGQAGCVVCPSSSRAIGNRTACECLGLNRHFVAGADVTSRAAVHASATCACRSGHRYTDPATGRRAPRGSDGAGACIAVVRASCASKTMARDHDGKCVPRDFCPSCPRGGAIIPGVGLCHCFETPEIDEICDAACRNRAQRHCIRPGATSLTLVDPEAAAEEGGEVEEDVELGEAVAGRASCAAELNRACCEVTPVAVTSRGFVGHYGWSAVVESPRLSSARRRRRRLSSVSNPIVCIAAGNSVIFDISPSSYPIYISKNADACLSSTLSGTDCLPWSSGDAFNSKAVAIGGDGEIVQALLQTFTAPGVYTFTLSSDGTQSMRVVVVGSGISCPASTGASGYITTSTSDSVKSLDFKSELDFYASIELADNKSSKTPQWGGHVAVLAVTALFAVAALTLTWVLQRIRWRSVALRFATKVAYRAKGQAGGFPASLHDAFRDGIATDEQQMSGVAADVTALDAEDLGPAQIMHRLAIHHGLAKHEYTAHVKGVRPRMMRQLDVQTNELKDTLDTTVLVLEGKRALKYLAEQWRLEIDRRKPFAHRLARRSGAIARLIAELTAVSPDITVETTMEQLTPNVLGEDAEASSARGLLRSQPVESPAFIEFRDSLSRLLSNSAEMMQAVEQEEWEEQRRLIKLTPSPALRHLETLDALVQAVYELNEECRQLWGELSSTVVPALKRLHATAIEQSTAQAQAVALSVARMHRMVILQEPEIDHLPPALFEAGPSGAVYNLRTGEGGMLQRAVLTRAVHRIYAQLGEVDLSIRDGTAALEKNRVRVEEATNALSTEIDRVLGIRVEVDANEEELEERLQVAEEDLFADQLVVGEEQAIAMFVSGEESRIQEIVLRIEERSGSGGGGADQDSSGRDAIIASLREDAENDAESLARDLERDRQEMQLKLRQRLARDRKKRKERKKEKTESVEEKQLHQELQETLEEVEAKHEAEIRALEEANAASLEEARKALSEKHSKQVSGALTSLQRMQQQAMDDFAAFEMPEEEDLLGDDTSAAIERLVARRTKHNEGIREIVLTQQNVSIESLDMFEMDDEVDEEIAMIDDARAAPINVIAKMEGATAKLDLLLQRDLDDAKAELTDALAHGVSLHEAELQVITREREREQERLRGVLSKQHDIAKRAAEQKLQRRKSWQKRQRQLQEASQQHEDVKDQLLADHESAVESARRRAAALEADAGGNADKGDDSFWKNALTTAVAKSIEADSAAVSNLEESVTKARNNFAQLQADERRKLEREADAADREAEAKLVGDAEAELKREEAERKAREANVIAQKKKTGKVSAIELVQLRSKFEGESKRMRKAMLSEQQMQVARLRKRRAAAREARMRKLEAKQRQKRSDEETESAKRMEEARLEDAKVRERHVLETVKADVPADHVDDSVRLVLQPRHNQEIAAMMAAHLKEMCAAKGAAHKRVREQKATELAELLTRLDYDNADAETIDSHVQQLRVKYEALAEEAKRAAAEGLEVRHAKAELDLKRQHLTEIIAATEELGGSAVPSSEREKALAMQSELQEFEEALEGKRQERIAAAKVDRKRLEEEAQRKMQEELKRIDEEISLKRQMQQKKIAEAMAEREKAHEARLAVEKEKLELKRMAMNREEYSLVMQKYEAEKQAASHQFNRVRQEQLARMENKLKLRKKRRRVKKQREHEVERRKIREEEEKRIRAAEADAAATKKVAVG